MGPASLQGCIVQGFLILWAGSPQKNPPHRPRCPGVSNQSDLYTALNTCFWGGGSRAKGSKILKLGYAMLAPFFALGRFLGAFCASCCVCCRFWLVFMRLGALLLDFGKFRKGPGRVLEAPKPYFARFFCPRTHAMRKRPDMRFVLEKPIRNACRPSSARR